MSVSVQKGGETRQISNYETFIKALNEKRIVTVTINTEEKGVIVRECVPFDYGPWNRNIRANPDRYHFYDLNSPEGEHNLSILPSQLISIEISNKSFNPGDYVKRTPKWFVQRNWGQFS